VRIQGGLAALGKDRALAENSWNLKRENSEIACVGQTKTKWTGFRPKCEFFTELDSQNKKGISFQARRKNLCNLEILKIQRERGST
jgi:hypothetical protein